MSLRPLQRGTHDTTENRERERREKGIERERKRERGGLKERRGTEERRGEEERKRWRVEGEKWTEEEEIKREGFSESESQNQSESITVRSGSWQQTWLKIH